MNAKLKIISKAILIRIDKGETLEDILDSYPALTDEDKTVLRDFVHDQLK